MTDISEVRRHADAVLAMIKEDQGTGQIPADVSSLDELDNHVDIEDYYRRIRLPAGDHDAAALRWAVGEEIGRRLAAAQSGPWHVIWRRPDGRTQDIGKTVGYATQAEAQAIGREHLNAHGGGFHLRRA
ncbi:MAG: hypothetical protein ACLQFR_12910 [Streptosporangiaceae bacterium]